ncbi:MAG: radical SAM protein, partial [Candidatus Acidiferrum sp.]
QIVTGCYAQRAPEELAALPGVTWVVGNSHKPQIPNLVTALSSNHPLAVSNNFVSTAALFPNSLEAPFHSFLGTQSAVPDFGKMSNPDAPSHQGQVLTGDIFTHPEFLSAPVQGGESHHTRPILKIQDGCNLRCSYCVIPFVRGKSRSLPPNDVIREIQKLTSNYSPEPPHAKVEQPILAVHSPAHEIVLSGINLGTYGRDLTPCIEFIDLLRRILNESSVERLRVSSIEPLDVTQDLIDLFAANPRIAEHFHMPLQSGSDRILAAMHRWYRAGHYARRVELIHDRLPNAAIGADVIAGFPGETESDHAATLAFIDQRPFTYLHVFSYSSRPGTKAAALPNQVPAPIIKRRARELRSLAESKSSAFRHSQQGRTLRVLTLHRNAQDERAGRTPALSTNYLPIHIPGILPANLWQDVVVRSEEGNYLIGEAASSLCESFVFSESFLLPEFSL